MSGGLVLRVLVAVAATVSLLTAPPAPAGAAAVDVVYVAPAGSDAASGLTSTTPVRSLARAQQLLAARRGDRPAEVRLAGGTYPVAGLRWSHSRPGQATTIRGTGVGGEARLSGGGGSTVLVIQPPSRTSMRLTLSNLKITNASNGVRVVNALDVTFRQVTFYRLGGTHTGVKGFSALGVTASARVLVQDSSFNQTRNSGADAGLFHAVYAAHDADGLRVRGSRFLLVSGDPVRLRNGSDGADIRDNVFERAGSGSYVSDWYGGGEAPSRGAVVTGNTLRSGYAGSRLPPSRCFDSLGHRCHSSRINAWGNRSG